MQSFSFINDSTIFLILALAILIGMAVLVRCVSRKSDIATPTTLLTSETALTGILVTVLIFESLGVAALALGPTDPFAAMRRSQVAQVVCPDYMPDCDTYRRGKVNYGPRSYTSQNEIGNRNEINPGSEEGQNDPGFFGFISDTVSNFWNTLFTDGYVFTPGGTSSEIIEPPQGNWFLSSISKFKNTLNDGISYVYDAITQRGTDTGINTRETTSTSRSSTRFAELPSPQSSPDSHPAQTNEVTWLEISSDRVAKLLRISNDQTVQIGKGSDGNTVVHVVDASGNSTVMQSEIHLYESSGDIALTGTVTVPGAGEVAITAKFATVGKNTDTPTTVVEFSATKMTNGKAGETTHEVIEMPEIHFNMDGSLDDLLTFEEINSIGRNYTQSEQDELDAYDAENRNTDWAENNDPVGRGTDYGSDAGPGDANNDTISGPADWAENNDPVGRGTDYGSDAGPGDANYVGPIPDASVDQGGILGWIESFNFFDGWFSDPVPQPPVADNIGPAYVDPTYGNNTPVGSVGDGGSNSWTGDVTRPGAGVNSGIDGINYDWVGRTPERGGGSNGGGSGSGCFIAGTQILMADGSLKSIETLTNTDYVMTSGGDQKVMKRYHIPYQGKMYAFNDSSHYFVTPSHPFMTPYGWKSIDPEATQKESPGLAVTQLTVGDSVLLRDGSPITITSLEAIEVNTTVYNFDVNGTHDYYADGFWVHNVATVYADDTNEWVNLK